MMCRANLVALLAIFFYPATLLAQPISVQLLQGRVYAAIDRPIPSTRELIGDGAATPTVPILAIGNLETDRADSDPDWGTAIGWSLMEYTNGAFREFTVVPSYQIHADSRTTVESDSKDRRGVLRRAAARTGAKYGLTGRISVRETQFDLQLQIIEFPSEKQVAVRQIKDALSRLPSALQSQTIDILHETFGTREAPLSATLPLPQQADIEALAHADSNGDKASGTARLALYEKLWRGRSESPTVAAAYLVVLNNLGSATDIREALPALTVRNDEVGTLEVYGQLIRSTNAVGGLEPDAVARLTRLLVSNPNNLGAWLALSDAYVGEHVMYREDARGMRYVISAAIDHHEGYAKGIAAALEAVGRWPNHYRSWWCLSHALKKYAGLVRGTAYWNNVPAAAQQRYRAIMAVGEESLNRALRLHPAHGTLYENMIEYDVHAKRNWLSTFRRAAELEPHQRRLYQTAFNYARPQWGGSKEDMREIYETAVRNNPDAKWPAELRDVWAAEIKPLIDFRNRWVQIVISALLLAGLALLWRRKKSRERDD